ncbi:heavy metal-binding domain-containing protein [Ammonicoccus fulvus]|uniref:UPF0145 protein AADG42_18120 n=1 Tax=Ammonicoccus fulvus TaxID=3138240 RepID=A0ABZ3FWG9_9ACTN
MLIVTSNGIPGYRIEAVLGEVMGMTVRAANLGKNITASFRSLGGGEVPEYTQLVYESRNEVMNRMWSECLRRGGNAIVAMRFDNGEIANNFTEVCAYGTAVVVTPIPEGEPGATPQSIARAAAANPGPGNWPRMDGQQLPTEGAVPPPVPEGQRPQAPAPEGVRPPAPAPEGQRPPENPRPPEEQRPSDDRPRRAEDQRPNTDGSWLDLG